MGKIRNMMQQLDIVKIQRIIYSFAQQLSFPVQIYLFGSRVTGKQTSESDMDIAIEPLIPDLDRTGRHNKVLDLEHNLRDLLHKATGLPVHVVFYDGNPHTQKGHDITTEGHILYSPNAE